MLAPCLSFYGKADFIKAGSHARIYAQRPFTHRLWKFRKSFRKFLTSIPDHHTIILSRETFSGGMPGHHTIFGSLMTSYSRPEKRLARVIISELRHRFGSEVDITFFYTTREREAWVRSVYGHLLRSIRVTDSFDQFRTKFPNLLSPNEQAEKLALTLAPVPVVIASLEAHASTPGGPAEALLDLVNIPDELRRKLKPGSSKNTANTPELQSEFLRLNREIKNKGKLKARKEALLSKRSERT